MVAFIISFDIVFTHRKWFNSIILFVWVSQCWIWLPLIVVASSISLLVLSESYLNELFVVGRQRQLCSHGWIKIKTVWTMDIEYAGTMKWPISFGSRAKIRKKFFFCIIYLLLSLKSLCMSMLKSNSSSGNIESFSIALKSDEVFWNRWDFAAYFWSLANKCSSS